MLRLQTDCGCGELENWLCAVSGHPAKWDYSRSDRLLQPQLPPGGKHFTSSSTSGDEVTCLFYVDFSQHDLDASIRLCELLLMSGIPSSMDAFSVQILTVLGSPLCVDASPNMLSGPWKLLAVLGHESDSLDIASKGTAYVHQPHPSMFSISFCQIPFRLWGCVAFKHRA